MLALSQSMDALKQASQPESPPESKTVQKGLENHEFSNQKAQEATCVNSSNSAGPSCRSAAVTAPTLNQEVPTGAHSSESQNILKTTSYRKLCPGISAGEPITRPQFSVRDSSDDLFGDVESDQDEMMNYDRDNEEQHDDSDGKEPTWASDGELFPLEAARPYNPNAPTEFYQDLNAQHFGSPQISPETPFYPAHQPSLKKTQTKDQGVEIQTSISEEDQIAYFSDKAFRRALREVEPSLSKEQQYYAWRNAYQNDYGEQPDSTIDHEESGQRSLTPDQNPPYQLGTQPVGYMDGVPIFADINTSRAMDEIDSRAEQTQYREYDSAEARRQQGDSPKETSEGSNFDAELEARPSKPFSTHHNMLAPTTPRADMAQRERMLESSLSQALQALEKDSAERIARESEVDEAHLRRLRSLSRRRSWAWDDGIGDSIDEEHASGGSTAARGREGSPEPPATRIGRERHNVSSPWKVNHDGSFATAFDSPDKQRGESETMRIIQAQRADDRRQQYARHHDQADEDGEPRSPSVQIPGLDHLNPPSPPAKHETSIPSLPPTPPSPKPRSFGPNVRKSIEPETPRHLLNRGCTPAFEDRSPTPSPRSLPGTGDGDIDMGMDEASSSPLPASAHHPRSNRGHNTPQPTLPHPRSPSPDPIPSPHHPGPQQQQQQQQQNQPQISPIPAKPPTQHPKSSHHPRRKSAILGPGIKIEKPAQKSSTPKSRNTTTSINKVAVVAAAAAAAITTATAKKDLSVPKENRVKAAVERIETSVRETVRERTSGRGTGKGNRAVKGTPPTRRSRRLIEKGEGERRSRSRSRYD